MRSGLRAGVRTLVLVGALVAGAVVTLAGQAGAESATAAEQSHHAQPLVNDTPCTASARACVDLESRQSWLLQDGRVVRGPVPIGIGSTDKATPIGHSLRVYLKDQDHVSSESSTNGVPDGMPYSVFFNDGGVAFHGGDPSTFSSGCVKLELEEAKAWFAFLQVGDQVQVVNGPEERTARNL